MKKKQTKKKYYYRDPVNDDFAKIEITPERLKDDYKYVRGTSKFYWFWSQVFRAVVCWPILYPIAKLTFAPKIVNKKVLKEVKDKGYFLYSNHTTMFDPIHHSVLVNPLKHTAIIASQETFSIKGLAGLINYLGAFPVPSSPKMYKNFLDCIKFHINAKHKVVVYPEAHIWPYYTDIRPFKSVSFRYACELNAPIIVATTTFKKRRFLKTPKVIIHLDGPIYPNNNLERKEKITDLCDRTYNIMCAHAHALDNYATYDYIYLKEGQK